MQVQKNEPAWAIGKISFVGVFLPVSKKKSKVLKLKLMAHCHI